MFRFVLWRPPGWLSSYNVDHVRDGEPYLRTRGMIASRSVNMARHPRGSYIVIPITVSGLATPENKVTHWRCHPSTRKQAQGAEVRLTSRSWKDAVHLSCDSPNTSRSFALGASNVCLVGK